MRLILSDILCSLSCVGTIINRQGIYHERFLHSENEVLSLSLQGNAEIEEERMPKLLEKWPMRVITRIDDTPVIFNFFLVSEKRTK